MDVVSLLPSATEICYVLDVEPVGVSHECDHPPEAAEVPSMNYSVVDGSGSSAGVNEAVAEAEDDDGVYAIDREALAATDPDLVLTQGVCDVCAVDRVLVEDAVADLGLDAEILTLDPHSMDDVFDDIERVGAATGRGQRAVEVAELLRERVDEVRECTAEVERRPRVAVLDWMDPVRVAPAGRGGTGWTPCGARATGSGGGWFARGAGTTSRHEGVARGRATGRRYERMTRRYWSSPPVGSNWTKPPPISRSWPGERAGAT
jgi:iron complex transport system substrate-binding protein